jgi:hypothetical protein
MPRVPDSRTYRDVTIEPRLSSPDGRHLAPRIVWCIRIAGLSSTPTYTTSVELERVIDRLLDEGDYDGFTRRLDTYRAEDGVIVPNEPRYLTLEEHRARRIRPHDCPRCGNRPDDWPTSVDGVCRACMDELHASLAVASDRIERLEYSLELETHRNFYLRKGA